MKYLGIVKWFGGYSGRFDKILDYGFIKVGEDDVFLHKRNVDEELLKDVKEGALLVFDIENNNDNKFMAANIEAFNIYNYFELIDELNLEEAIEVILRDLVTLKDSKAKYEEYLKQIPEKFIMESKIIRNKVHYKTILSKLAGLFSVTNNLELISVLDEFLTNELEENFFYKEEPRVKYSYMNTNENRKVTVEYTNDIRILIQNSSILYKYLDVKSKYRYLIELCMENLVSDYKNITEELEVIVNENPGIYTGEYSRELNNLYKNSDLFYSKLSDADKVKFLFENYEEDGDLQFLIGRFELLNNYYISNLNYKEDLYEIISRSDSIFENLNATCKIEYLIRHYDKNADMDYIIEKFKNIFMAIGVDTLNKLPDAIIECEEVWNKLSEYLKIRYYLSKDKELTSKQILEMERYYEDTREHEKAELDKIICNNYELQIKFSKLILPEKQAKMFFKQEIEWTSLTWEAQIMVIFKLSKENLEFGFLRAYKDDIVKNKLVHAACTILFAKNLSNKNLEFLKAHDLIQEYVIERAWNLEHKINLDLILPMCDASSNSKYSRYCDCRPWNRKIKQDDDMEEAYIEEETIYCPYKRREASQPGYREGGGISCAKLKPEIYSEWYDWSFKELIYKSGMKPLLDTKIMEYEYTNKLSGWVNRLNQVRERLRCSHCGEVCRPNYKYSKNLAKFNTTVITCIDSHNKEKHDKNVYLNQCWNCQEIIDSRESTKKAEGYYICIKCGAGPQYPEEYVQGSICPKCESKNMERYTPYITDMYNQLTHFKCKDCGHTIDTRRRF